MVIGELLIFSTEVPILEKLVSTSGKLGGVAGVLAGALIWKVKDKKKWKEGMNK